MKRAVFLDRDGVINKEKNYLYKIDEFEFVEGVITSLKKLKEEGFLLIVITNQSGVGRGYYSEEDVNKLHEFINMELMRENIQIDDFYYCPHHHIHGHGEYKKKCDCRKPNTGMLQKAIKEYSIDINKSYLVGDRKSDIDCGRKIGLKNLLVRTGYGKKTEEYFRNHEEYYDIEIFDNLSEIVNKICIS